MSPANTPGLLFSLVYSIPYLYGAPTHTTLQALLSDTVIWFLLGLLLLLAELVVPGLIIFFFGIGAWAAALCCLLFDPPLNAQLLIFLGVSLLSLAMLRRTICRRYTGRGKTPADLSEDYVGRAAIAVEDFDSSGCGKVSFKGSIWDAESSRPGILKGQQVIITGFESIKLYVKPSSN